MERIGIRFCPPHRIMRVTGGHTNLSRDTTAKTNRKEIPDYGKGQS